MRVLVLRLTAPLMAFGDVRVDARGPIRDHPGLGMVAGLLGNALGYDHADAQRLTRLQERLHLASRCDRPGERIVDFHTVDLGQDFMREGWTTRGTVEGRKGGVASEGTHIRLRQFHADRVQTLAVSLAQGDETPTVDDIASAVDSPCRPLFLGRKPCLPSTRMVIGVVEAVDLVMALTNAPRWRHRHARMTTGACPAWWPEDPDTAPPAGSHVSAVVDQRDWQGQVVVGRRLVRHGSVMPVEADHA